MIVSFRSNFSNNLQTFQNGILVCTFVNERELMSCSLCVVVRPSVCRLSSVTFVHPTQAIEIFGNVSTPFGLRPFGKNFYGDRPRETPPSGG